MTAYPAADDNFIRHWRVHFSSPIKIFFSYCGEFPVQPGDEVDKIWTFRKTATAFIVECNGVEVLNNQMSAGCASKWGGDVVEKILFDGRDTASDSYQQKLPIATKGESTRHHSQFV